MQFKCFHSAGSLDEWAQSGHAPFLSSVDREFHDRTPIDARVTGSIGRVIAVLRKQAPRIPVTQGIEKMVVNVKVSMERRSIFACENCVPTDGDRRHIDWGWFV